MSPISGKDPKPNPPRREPDQADPDHPLYVPADDWEKIHRCPIDDVNLLEWEPTKSDPGEVGKRIHELTGGMLLCDYYINEPENGDEEPGISYWFYGSYTRDEFRAALNDQGHLEAQLVEELARISDVYMRLAVIVARKSGVPFSRFQDYRSRPSNPRRQSFVG